MLWLEDRGSIPGKAGLFCLPQCPDRIWGPPSLLSNGYWGFLPRDKAAGS
jgi:hypothetical protein